jgi:hypothetical protein
MPDGPARALPRRPRFPWRRWLRALHRDVGYLSVGLTVVYAASGLAVNHIGEWDPNFVQYDETRELGRALEGDDREVARIALAALDLDDEPEDVYRFEPGRVEVVLADKTIHVDTTTGFIYGEGQEPRFFLRVANWLHLNRGKEAWTVFADGYAVFLLFLATSGLFMLSGRKGLLGRGGVLTVIGVLVPVLYLLLSGGP